ncbi:MAG TPA: serine hydrolase, partial [Flavobacterium sp.]|nr:serine hydrolase [Flavobacterium sp.]
MKKFFKFLGIAILLFIIYIGITTYPKLDIVSGFSAKSVASGHFIDGRSLEIIEKGDNDIDNVRLATNEINEKEKVVYSSAFGLKERKAIYREGLGATLINDDFDETKPYLIPKRTKIETNLPFPYGNL